MARSIGDVISEARVILNDRQVPLRYPDTSLYGILDNAVGVARRIRPDLFLDLGLRSEPAPLIPAMAALPFPLEWYYVSAFVWYVAGRAELRDDESTENSRALALMQKFTAELVTLT